MAAIVRLDETLHAIYAAAGVPMAAVGRAFEMTQSEPVYLAGVGDVPETSHGPAPSPGCAPRASPRAKQHPNEAGYQVIAQAIAAAVPA